MSWCIHLSYCHHDYSIQCHKVNKVNIIVILYLSMSLFVYLIIPELIKLDEHVVWADVSTIHTAIMADLITIHCHKVQPLQTIYFIESDLVWWIKLILNNSGHNKVWKLAQGISQENFQMCLSFSFYNYKIVFKVRISYPLQT